MDVKKTKAAREVAKRFIAACERIEDRDAKEKASGSQYPCNPYSGSVESGALRRASLDLTRALADLRR